MDNSNNHVRLPPDTPLDELALRGLKTIELEVGQEEEEEEEKQKGDEQLKIGFWNEWEKAEKEKDMRTDPERPQAVFPPLNDKPNINPHPHPHPIPHPSPNPNLINPTTITPNHPSRSTLPPPQTPIISNPTNPPAATLSQNQNPNQLGEKSEGRITRLTLDDLLALENDDPSSLPASITG